MSSLYASRWASTPPTEKPVEASPIEQGRGEGVGEIAEAVKPKLIQDHGAASEDQHNDTADSSDHKKENDTSLPINKPLPSPPDETLAEKVEGANEIRNEQSTGQANSQGLVEIQNDVAQSLAAPQFGAGSATEVLRNSPTHSDPPRHKKKVICHGRNIVIYIPNVDFQALGLPMPMTLDEAEKRLREFALMGYDVRGFSYWHDPDASELPSVKPLYPDEQEARTLARQEHPKVLLPDLNKAKEDEQRLIEAKLAALGVLSTDAEEPPLPPAPRAQDMSRQSSGQYPPLPFSPPVPTGSGGNLNRPVILRGHSHTMSVASPLSPVNGPFGHMHRHSTFSGPLGLPPLQTQQANFPLQSPVQPLVPNVQAFSPSGQFNLPGLPVLPRGGSPAQLAALRQDLGAVRGAGSPLSQQVFPQTSQDYSRVLMDDQRRRSHAYSQSVQYPPMQQVFLPQAPHFQQTPALPELPEEDDEEELREPVVHPPVPVPDPPAYVPPHKRAQINADVAIPTPTRGHRHNISEGLERDILEAEQRHEAERRNWIEVTESSEPLKRIHPPRTQEVERDPLGQELPVQDAVHSHKRSATRFNVAAPSFNFNPSASFQPANPTAAIGQPPLKPAGIQTNGHTRQASSGNFNVAAPVFKPSSAPFVPNSSLSFAAKGTAFTPNAPSFEPRPPKSNFSFSAQGPAFTASAPSFEPTPPRSAERTIIDDLPSIFGKVKIPQYPDMVPPTRKSKAVPIVRPQDEDTPEASAEEFFDEDGHLGRSGDQFKRHRALRDNGDEVPRFAEPTPMPDPADFSGKEPVQVIEEIKTAAEVEQVEAQVEDVLDDIAVKAADTVESAIQMAQEERHQNEVVPVPAHRHKPSSSLSALAKPFEPPTQQLRPGNGVGSSHDRFASISELEDGEIVEDENPIVSPVPPEEPAETSLPEIPGYRIPSADRIATVAHPEPSFDEIDAVMRQLNEIDEEPDRQQHDAVSPLPELDEQPIPGVTYLPPWSRSDAPSPSPKRQPIPYLPQAESSFTVHDRTDSADQEHMGWPHVNRLNREDDAAPSDWSDDFIGDDKDKLQQRSAFFDNHIESVIGQVVARRLLPLEESLRGIYNAVSKRQQSSDGPSLKRSSSNVDSDADDEDELSDVQQQRPLSRGRDKRIDQIKMAVIEALREQSPKRSHSAYDIADLHSALADMKVSFARAASASLELDDIRAVVEEVLQRQNQALVLARPEEGRGEHKRELSELEGRLNETLAGALEEANLRRAAEEREAEMRRLLRIAEEELSLLRENSRDDDGKLNAMEEERIELLNRIERAEESQRRAEEHAKSLEAEGEAMQATLAEYRISSTKWRQDLDDAKHEREELENTISALERQVEESEDASNTMRRRLEKLHSDMATAAGQLASEKAGWQARETEYRRRCEDLEEGLATSNKRAREAKDELQKLKAQPLPPTEPKVDYDALRSTNASLQEEISKLRVELADQQALAVRLQRDVHTAEEVGRVEAMRTRATLEAELEAAKAQVDIVRARLESELRISKDDRDQLKAELESLKAKYESIRLAEAEEHRDALLKSAETSRSLLDEARQKHEKMLKDATEEYQRALQHAVEDKNHLQYIMSEKLALSDAKLQHSQDRILYLEERLEVAKSAAQAAVLSKQARSSSSATSSSTAPEKVSPQALRESILVLQEQLQDREARIERLQSQVNNEGPAQLKERDTEIAWLRELLAVRNDDLTELVNTLSRPTFNRESVRDTAIRLRANLQMEQQEKERFNTTGVASLGGQALASLSSFATPRAASLTSAFNKWRSTMESSALKNGSRPPAPQRSSTPSKPSSSSSGRPTYNNAGLMTPPASNLRNTPSPEATKALPPPRMQAPSTQQPYIAPTAAGVSSAHGAQLSEEVEEPITPLFREQSYDRDAEDSKVHLQSFEDEEDNDDDLDVEDSQPPAFRSLAAELEDESEQA